MKGKKEKKISTIFCKKLPAVDRVELPLEELEAKCKDATMKMYQCWQGRSREWVTSDLTGQTVPGRSHKVIMKKILCTV